MPRKENTIPVVNQPGTHWLTASGQYLPARAEGDPFTSPAMSQSTALTGMLTKSSAGEVDELIKLAPYANAPGPVILMGLGGVEHEVVREHVERTASAEIDLVTRAYGDKSRTLRRYTIATVRDDQVGAFSSFLPVYGGNQSPEVVDMETSRQVCLRSLDYLKARDVYSNVTPGVTYRTVTAGGDWTGAGEMREQIRDLCVPFAKRIGKAANQLTVSFFNDTMQKALNDAFFIERRTPVVGATFPDEAELARYLGVKNVQRVAPAGRTDISQPSDYFLPDLVVIHYSANDMEMAMGGRTWCQTYRIGGAEGTALLPVAYESRTSTAQPWQVWEHLEIHDFECAEAIDTPT